MKASKEEVKNAILFFAALFEQKDNYAAIMLEHSGSLTRIVEMLVYEMFLRKFNSFHCTDEEYDHYKVLFEYATEMKNNGWVTHEQ